MSWTELLTTYYEHKASNDTTFTQSFFLYFETVKINNAHHPYHLILLDV